MHSVPAGSLWMNKALHRMTHGEGRPADEYLKHIAQNIKAAPFAPSAKPAQPVLSFVDKFKDKFEEKTSA